MKYEELGDSIIFNVKSDRAGKWSIVDALEQVTLFWKTVAHYEVFRRKLFDSVIIKIDRGDIIVPPNVLHIEVEPSGIEGLVIPKQSKDEIIEMAKKNPPIQGLPITPDVYKNEDVSDLAVIKSMVRIAALDNDSLPRTKKIKRDCPLIRKCEKHINAERQDDFCYKDSLSDFEYCPTYKILVGVKQ